MVEWCDLYQKCEYYSFEYTDFDIFGHDSMICKCSKTGTPIEICLENVFNAMLSIVS